MAITSLHLWAEYAAASLPSIVTIVRFMVEFVSWADIVNRAFLLWIYMQSSKPRQELFQPNTLDKGRKWTKTPDLSDDILTIGNISKHFGRLNKWESRSGNQNTLCRFRMHQIRDSRSECDSLNVNRARTWRTISHWWAKPARPQREREAAILFSRSSSFLLEDDAIFSFLRSAKNYSRKGINACPKCLP